MELILNGERVRCPDEVADEPLLGTLRDLNLRTGAASTAAPVSALPVRCTPTAPHAA